LWRGAGVTLTRIFLSYNLGPTTSFFKGYLSCLVSKEIFTLDAMLGKNCRGWGKPKLDANKMYAVQVITLHHFPCEKKEEDTIWRLCEKAIDTMLRNETSKRLKKSRE
jgi:hypothetical protein